MQKLRMISLVICISLLVFSLSFFSCSFPKRSFTKHSFSYFDTLTTIIGYEHNEKEFNETAQAILEKLEEYHKLYDIYHSYAGINNLYTVNETINGTHREVTVDARILNLLQYSKEIYIKTNGSVNVAMGSVLTIWHAARQAAKADSSSAKLPSMEELQSASMHTDIQNIVINSQKNTVFLADPQMLLDVGAIAKGYATEQVALWMEEHGISGYSLNVGGNVRTVGARGDGKSWSVGIEDPNNDDETAYLHLLQLNSASLVTSGSYQRFYTVNGKNYHHIIDSKTLMPAEYFTSVSVVCRDSALADALSTALFCMPYETGLLFAAEFDAVEVLWLFTDGTVKTTAGFQDYVVK